MSSVALRNDTLIEIATFLVRRWSENDKIVVTMSSKKTNETRMKDNKLSDQDIEKIIKEIIILKKDIIEEKGQESFSILM